MEPKTFIDWLIDWAEESSRNEIAFWCLVITLGAAAALVYIGVLWVTFSVHWAVGLGVMFSPVLIGAAIPIVEYVNSQGAAE